MLRLIICVAIICTTSGLSEIRSRSETCTSSNFQSYSSSGFFTSIKSDGSKYECTCQGSICQTINCVLTSMPTPESKPQAFYQQPQPVLPAAPPGVRSQCPGTYKMGEIVRKNGKVCECMIRNGRPELVCDSCERPDPIVRRHVPSTYPSCYDPWNDRIYRHGATYNRSRLMDQERGITGRYSCLCKFGEMECQVADVPCCDISTNKYVPIGERFAKRFGGRWADCVCADGQQHKNCSFTRVQPLQAPGIVTSLRPRVSNTRVSSRLKTCYDQRNNAYYQHGMVYSQLRQNLLGQLERWTCKCIIKHLSTRVTCRFGNPYGERLTKSCSTSHTKKHYFIGQKFTSGGAKCMCSLTSGTPIIECLLG